MKKRFMVALYNDNEDKLDMFDVSARHEVVAVLKAIKQKEFEAYKAYIEWTDACDMDLGGVGDIKEFFHEWMTIAVKEIV
ncbi:hypothetical protein VPHD51_0114 [Vibrio phage D51]